MALTPPILRPSPLVLALAAAFALPAAADTPPPAAPGQTVIDADRIDGQMESRIQARGDVVIRRDDQTIKADWLDYFQSENRVKAGDKVEFVDGANRVDAHALDYNVATREGEASDASFAGRGEDGRTLRGDGEKIEFKGRDRYRLVRARANTCAPGDDSWYLKAGTIDVDYTRNVGVARHARLDFQGVPILYTPWIDFPLDGGRKSGLLAPVLKTGSDGFELALPYYFNLAPNYDLTLTPRVFAERGAMLGAEFRYLQPGYSGSIFTEQMPDDKVYGQSRAAWRVRHAQNLGAGFSLGYDLNYVSDADYFKDFGSRVDIASNVNLARDAWLNYGRSWDGGGASGQLRLLRYQTLQDADTPVTPPYALLPRLSGSATQALPAGFSADVFAEFTRFTHPTLQDGNRLVVYPSVAWAFERNWGFLRPRLGVHVTEYELDALGERQAERRSRTLPVFSTDAGLVFERPSTLFGRSHTQTLEPRLFYVNVPTRDQSELPNFDSAEKDFSFAQLFTANRFTGQDRINGVHALTVALSSRYLDDASGLERLRVELGQRHYLRKDSISLSGAPEELENRGSDLVATVGGDLTRAWRADASYQYNQQLGKTERYEWGARYSPEPGKTVSLRYRYGRDEDVGFGGVRAPLRQVDVAAQWPVARKWYVVARNNYSLTDKTALEQLAGVEYNDGCWTARVVGQRYVTDLTNTKNAVFLQLELKDLGGIGSNPVDTLRLAIPGYSKINDPRQGL
ncbi:LPS biosynthesis protein [Crenobacter luteus]|uniref:LPS-assembly protein LptD n=1 Tax=Crenobacter luteus TaxID=1452487 RepID=A0A165FVR4_9NEIS|nr:LPS biosynthesis protein [Crenobacter luteus]